MRHGKRVRKTPLPEAPSAPGSVTLRRWRERLPMATCIEIPKVLIPEDLRGCDPLISATRRALEKEKPWDRGLLRARGDGVFNVNVSRASVHRALILLEAILRAGKQKGWGFESEDKASVSVRIAEDAVAFGIEERVTRTEQPPKPGDEKYTWISKKYDHHPTGLLSIRIFDHLGNGGLRSSWNDGKRQRLEDQLGDVLIGFETASEALKKQRLKHEEWKRECAQRERERRDLAIRINAERDRREELLKQSENLATAAKIRNLVKELRERSLSDGEKFHPEEVARWSEWAMKVARWYDPFERAYYQKALRYEQLEGDLQVPEKGSFW